MNKSIIVVCTLVFYDILFLCNILIRAFLNVDILHTYNLYKNWIMLKIQRTNLYNAVKFNFNNR